MPCSVCAAPLFTWEAAVGLCRAHGLNDSTPHEGQVALRMDGSAHVEPNYRYDALTELRDLGSILPPIPQRGESVRLVRSVVVVPRVELTDAPDLVLRGGAIDPVTRQPNGEDKHFRIVRP